MQLNMYEMIEYTQNNRKSVAVRNKIKKKKICCSCLKASSADLYLYVDCIRSGFLWQGVKIMKGKKTQQTADVKHLTFILEHQLFLDL